MRRHRSLAVALAVAVAGLLGSGPAEGAPAQGEHPVVYSSTAAFLHAALHPDTPPAGANDWSCDPSEDRPNPVVLAHGLSANQTVNWQTFSPLLHNEGYCVFTLTYGLKDGVGLPIYEPGGLTRMEDSAEELADFVDEVLATTGAAPGDRRGP
jgi:triacylglycerol lipase